MRRLGVIRDWGSKPLLGVVGVVRGQAVTHEPDGLGTLLGDRRVGGSEFRGQVLDGPVAEVDLLDHVAHPLGEGLHGGPQVLEPFVREHGVFRGQGFGGQGVHDGLIEWRQGAGGIRERGLHDALLDAQGRGDLVHGGGASEGGRPGFPARTWFP